MKTFSNLIRPGVIALSGAALILASGCDSRHSAATQPAAAPASVGTGIDDGIVTAKVKSALLADPAVRSFDLKVETRSGEVMLSGFVQDSSQVERALSVARGVEGVKAVTDGMTLKDGPATIGNTVDDGIITAKIKSVLLADPNIKSFDIAVVTQKGRTQLSGFVNNQTQIDHATALARSVQGVTEVASEMSIKQ
jgi:hyperosmotically inducible protein